MSAPFDLSWNPAGWNLAAPLSWPTPARVNVEDLFRKTSNEEIAAVFGVMAACPQHTFAIATDHPERMREWFRWLSETIAAERVGTPLWILTRFVERIGGERLHPILDAMYDSAAAINAIQQRPLPNICLGVRVTDQRTADERIPALLNTPAALRFVDVVPTGPVDLRRIRRPGSNPAAPAVCALTGGWMVPRNDGTHRQEPRVHWIVVSAPAGPAAQPCDVEWIRGIVTQCREAAAPVFVRQLGSLVYETGYDFVGDGVSTTTDLLKLTDPNGADPAEWPEDLRVRELP